MDKYEFKVNLKWTQERKGVLSSPELVDGVSATDNSIEVATPAQFPKGIPNIWTPDHLFTASVNSCLMSTFLAVAENSKLEFAAYECEAIGIIKINEGKSMIAEVSLKPRLTILEEKDRDRAERILLKSQKLCLISNSIKSKISMKIRIDIA